MKPTEHILIPIGETEASEKAVAYLGRMLAGKANCKIHLFHVVEPIPPYFVSLHGDLNTIPEGTSGGADVIVIEEAKKRTKPIIQRMVEILVNQGLETDNVEASWFIAAREDSLPAEILKFAKENGFSTIVVGRTSLPWYREFFRSHVGESLVRKAEELAIWIVE